MRYYLTQVKIEGFRGINNEGDPLELRFRPDCVNSVYATNGLGKSSIFEALCYAIKGSVPKLDRLQAADEPDQYITNRFHSQQTATVELEFTPDDGTSSAIFILVQRDYRGRRSVTSPSGHPDPKDFLASLDEEFVLVDYQQFTRFVDSTANDRGRLFSPMLGLSRYSDLRHMLQYVSDTRVLDTDFHINSLQTEVASAGANAEREFRRLTTTYEGVTNRPLPEKDINLATISSDIISTLSGVELLKPHIEGRNLSEVDFSAIKVLIEKEDRGEKRKELATLNKTTLDLQTLAPTEGVGYEPEQAALRNMISDRLELLQATRGELFQNLYNAAEALLLSGGWDDMAQCPLCDTKPVSDISVHVKNHLEHYQQVLKKSEEISAHCRQAEWVKRLQLLEESTYLRGDITEYAAQKIIQEADSQELTLEVVQAGIDRLVILENGRITKLREAVENHTKLVAELPKSLVTLTTQVVAAEQFKDAVLNYQNYRKLNQSREETLSQRMRWKNFISGAARKFAAAETEAAQAKIREIDSDYKDLFAEIMNNPEVIPKLERAGQRENLDLQLSNFYGEQDVPAVPLLAESYRNALVISVYLSAAMSHSGAPRFIMLDDVTSSFDAGHQWLLMDLIRRRLQQPANSDGLQFILLSHDGLLEKYFDKLSSSSDWHHQKLSGLPPKGTIFTNVQDANRLRTTAETYLRAGEVEKAAIPLRQYLEYKLFEIIRRLRIDVPYDFAVSDHSKMVGNSLKAIQKAILLHQSAGNIVLEDQQVLNLVSAHMPAMAVNWVSHYETATGAGISPHVLLGVLDTTDNISECFKYDDTVDGTVQRKWYKSLSSR